jgi:hypothetical protein
MKKCMLRLEWYLMMKHRLKTNAAIPKGFYKTIQYGSMSETYYFPNINLVSKEINDYKIK